MIHLGIRLTNPWSRRWEILVCKHGRISQHKAWEFNIYATHDIIQVSVDITPRGDHSGAQLMIGLLGYAVEFNFYDTRHSDEIESNWT